MVRVTASVWVRTFEVIVKCRCVANVINTYTVAEYTGSALQLTKIQTRQCSSCIV